MKDVAFDVTLDDIESASLTATLHDEVTMEVTLVPIPLAEYTFEWTVPTTGNQWTVTIPNNIQMLDVSYVTSSYAYSDIPEGGAAAGLAFPSTGKTVTTFLVQTTDGELLAGTKVSITLRDV